jgi:predicted nucleic acid-binding protein
MALPVTGKVVLDTNVFIDHLRADLQADWVFGRVENVVRFLSSVVLLELRLGAGTLPRRRAVDRIKSAFPASRLVAPAPDLYDRAAVLFRVLYGDGNSLADRLGPINDLLIALSAWRIGATVVTGNLRHFRRIQKHLPGLRVAAP